MIICILRLDNKYYIYLHVKKTNGEPFYIGKGTGKRCEVKHSRSSHWKNIVNKHDYDIILLETNLTIEESINYEKYWIKRIGRKDLNLGTLVNFTDGGEGTSNRPMSDYSKKKLIERNSTLPKTQKQLDNLGSLFRGKSGELHNRSKKVICLTTNEEFGSFSEAERYFKMGGGCISLAIKNNKPTHGLHFEINS